MVDPYRAELTATYCVLENLDWAARERLTRQVRPSIEKRDRMSFGINLGSLFARVAHAYAHA
jgi:hypothetical protein